MTAPVTPPTNWGSISAIAGVLAVLAGASVMAVVSGTLDGTQVAGLVSIIAGSTAVAGGLTLAGDGKASDLVPHLILILAVIGMTVALALEHVYTSTEVTMILGFIIGGGGTGAGVGVTNAKLNALAAVHHGVLTETPTETPAEIPADFATPPAPTGGPPTGLPVQP